MRVLSLFDGISCGMAALERADIPVEAYDAFEIDKYAVTVSEKNYPQIRHHGNVFDGDFRKFKGYDLLLGGSPVHTGRSQSKAEKPQATVKASNFSANMCEPYENRNAVTFSMRITIPFIGTSRMRSQTSRC